jgi:signal peptidase I
MSELRLTPSPGTKPAQTQVITSTLWGRVILGLVLIAGLLIVGVVIALPLVGKAFELKGFRCSSSSMCPTICLDEYVLASMNAYRGRAPQRSDVILHSTPKNTAPFIKRVIGVPGDVVSPGPHNEVLVDGNPLLEPKVCGKPVRSDPSDSGSLPFEAVKIPEGFFFVVGDNLSNSYDSRSFGLIALNQVKGKALLLYWSPENSRIGCPVR